MKTIDIIENNSKIIYEKIKEKYDIKLAIGLIGYGSECYGFDDIYSQDHDFTYMPCIWLETEDYNKYKDELELIINNLNLGTNSPKTLWNIDRRGILDINQYIYSFLGSTQGPVNDIDYRNIPQYLLSSFTNGKIFIDETGKITKLREKVKFYPRDIRYNMIATRIMIISREGLYNYNRMIKRNEYVASTLALAKTIEAIIELYFLIYKQYCPYYKWQHKMLKQFDTKAYELIDQLVSDEITQNKKYDILDTLCSDIIDKLEQEQIIIRVNDYLGYYGPIIQSRIDNEKIRQIGCWED